MFLKQVQSLLQIYHSFVAVTENMSIYYGSTALILHIKSPNTLTFVLGHVVYPIKEASLTVEQLFNLPVKIYDDHETLVAILVSFQ